MGNCFLYKEQEKNLAVRVNMVHIESFLEFDTANKELVLNLQYHHGQENIREYGNKMLYKSGAFYVDPDVYPPAIQSETLDLCFQTVNLISKETYNNHGIELKEGIMWIICDCEIDLTITYGSRSVPLVEPLVILDEEGRNLRDKPFYIPLKPQKHNKFTPYTCQLLKYDETIALPILKSTVKL